jgi:8-oxo-dGTP diphosphatase
MPPENPLMVELLAQVTDFDSAVHALKVLWEKNVISSEASNFQEILYKWYKSFSDRMPRVGVGSMISHEGSILMGIRGDTYGKGCLSDAGGRLDFCESISAAAVREAKEETDLDVKVEPYQGNAWFLVTEDVNPYYRTHFVTFWVKTVSLSSVPVPKNKEPNKCLGWQWYSWDEAVSKVRSIQQASGTEEALYWFPYDKLEPYRGFLGI